MFFMFQILMFTIIYPIRLNSFVLREEQKFRDIFFGGSPADNTETEDDETITNFSTPKPLFEILQNLTSYTNTKNPNLKVNVFDQMLSEEMLSLKQHIYERNTTTSSISTVSKNIPRTPTLEVKQKWSFIQFDANNIKTKQTFSTTQEYHNTRDVVTNSAISDIKNKIAAQPENEKVVELRSLPEPTPHSAHPVYLYHGAKICTCMQTNPSTACNHLGTTSGKNLCSHGLCTRYQPFVSYEYTISPPFYISYEPYFIGVTDMPNFNNYYHPDVINELKISRKSRRRKTTKVDLIDDDLYYEIEEHTERRSNKKKHYDDYVEYEKTPTTSATTGSTTTSTTTTATTTTAVTTTVTYSTTATSTNIAPHENLLFRVEEKGKAKKECGDTKIRLKHANDEGLVSGIVEDLKAMYSDSVIKDCYCKSVSWSQTLYPMNTPTYVLSLLLFLLRYLN